MTALAHRTHSQRGASARAAGGRHLSWRNEGLERWGFLEGLEERRFRVRERESLVSVFQVNTTGERERMHGC